MARQKKYRHAVLLLFIWNNGLDMLEKRCLYSYALPL